MTGYTIAVGGGMSCTSAAFRGCTRMTVVTCGTFGSMKPMDGLRQEFGGSVSGSTQCRRSVATGAKNRFAVHKIRLMCQIMLGQNVIESIGAMTFGAVDLIGCRDYRFGCCNNFTGCIFYSLFNNL